MDVLEAGAQARGIIDLRIARLDGEQRVGSGIADMGAKVARDRRLADALRGKFGAAFGIEFAAKASECSRGIIVERDAERFLPRRANVGQTHAIGRKQAGHRMQENALHAERIGHQTGMLTTRAAETVQRIARHVIAALDRNLLDRLDHVGDSDADEAVGDVLGTAAIADLPRHFLEFFAHYRDVERLVLRGPEDRRKALRQEFAEHDVGIGDGQRPAIAIAGRAGIGAGRIRPDAKPPRVIMQDRSAAGRDGVDEHHRRADANACDLGFEGAFELAVEMRDVGRRAAHVEADDLVETGGIAGAGKPDHAARRTGQDRILALEEIGSGQAARRHHEHHPRTGPRDVQFVGDLRDVAAKDGREIGVDDGRVAAPDQLDERRNLVADGDLAKADLARDPRRLDLMGGVFIGVHEHDRDGVVAFLSQRQELEAKRVRVERRLDRAIGKHALADLDDPVIKRFRLDDLGGEDVLALLIADLQGIAETARRHQCKPFALALQKRVCRNGGAHAHFANQAGGHGLGRLQPEQLANAVDGRVAVGRRIFRQHLDRVEDAPRIAPDHVGEGAATVNPEIPLCHRFAIPV